MMNAEMENLYNQINDFGSQVSEDMADLNFALAALMNELCTVNQQKMIMELITKRSEKIKEEKKNDK